MPFKDEQISQWLGDKWKGNKTCPICLSNSWIVDEKPVELRDYTGGRFGARESVYPLIIITCNVCGYTLLFNAMVAGLIENKKGKK